MTLKEAITLFGYHQCIFRRIPATDSDPKRPPIPRQSGHLFRFIPATLERLIEAALDNRFESL